MKIGWSSRDVTCNGPALIGGQAHERISKFVLDPTTVTALVIEDGGDYVVFISGDFTSWEGSFLHELKEAAQARIPGFDGKKILLNATHTHTAPRYQRCLGYDKAPTDRLELIDYLEYREFLKKNMVDAIEEAYLGRKSGSFAYGYSTATVGLQRRVTFFNDRSVNNVKGNTFGVNGHGQMYGKTAQDDFDSYEGPTDNNVYLLYTFDAADKLTGAIINVPCPSQCTENEYYTSADYWHETRQLIRQKYGNIYILPQCAAAGDLSPHPLHAFPAWDRQIRIKYADVPAIEGMIRPREFYNRRDIAQKIAFAFDECYQWASREKYTDAPIVHVTKTLELERWKVTEQELQDAQENYAELQSRQFQNTDDPYADFVENTKLSSNLSRCEKVMENYQKNGDPVHTEIHVLKIGDIAFTSCPFELYLAYQHRIQARSPFVQTFMVQLASSDTDAAGSYLCTRRAAANKGYSAIMFSCHVTPAGGQTLVDEILKELNEIV